jgi:hypothetical protein
LCLPPEGKGTLRIVEGKRSDLYYFAEVSADYGRGFRVEKVGGDTYSVNLDGRASTCECKGFGRWAHCRHVESLTALIAAGKLPPQTNGRA